MSINLGGIAKGYALDYAAKQLKQRFGFERGFIDIGGNALALPEPPPPKQTAGQPFSFRNLFTRMGLRETPYSAGIRNPFSSDPSSICGIVTLQNEAISTSGSYERYLMINGKRYSHIINPKTGYPVENMLSVTVIAPSGMDSDVLSTAIFVAGPEFALEFHEKNPDFRALIFQLNPQDPSKVQSFVIGEGFDFSVPEVPVPQSEASTGQEQERPDSPAQEEIKTQPYHEDKIPSIRAASTGPGLTGSGILWNTAIMIDSVDL